MKRRLIYVAIATIALCALAAAGAHAIPTMGIYFSAPGCGEHQFLQPEPFVFFPAYLYICDADHFVTAVEYQIQTPNDPSHGLFIIVETSLPNRKVLTLGDPFQGHAITFWPPLDGFTDRYNFICAYNCLTLAPCSDPVMYDYQIVVGPDPRSGHLRGAYYPDHELFDIVGMWSTLCDWMGRCASYIGDVIVTSPLQVGARFSFKAEESSAEDLSNYSLYETWNPESAIPVTNVTLLADSQTVLVDLGAALAQETAGYSLRVDDIRDVEGYTRTCPSVGLIEYCADLEAFDLVVAPDKIYEACTPYEIDFEVTNRGDYEAGPFRVRVRFDWDSGEGITQEIVDTLRYGGLAPGETLHVHSGFTMPPLRGTFQYVRVYADDLEEVTECSESNNGAEDMLFNSTPCILSIEDVPGDTGGWVSMTFSKTYYDKKSGGVTGYEIYRAADPPPGWDLIDWVPAAQQDEYTVMLPSTGDSTGAGIHWSYYYVRAVKPVEDPPDTIYYITCPDSGYSVNNSPVSDAPVPQALPLTLFQNYPNPFNPVTTVSFHLPVGRRVVLEIFDVSGRRVACLIDGYCEPGRHDIEWGGRDMLGQPVSSGVYFYRLRAGTETISRKMALLR